ncbi:MAG: MFS transporter [Chloroflexi bacterium]|nr:MAG: MFS transporter [Chloroflexota bacterium]
MTSPSSSPRPRRQIRGLLLDVAPLRLDRDYRLLWTGQVVSSMGNQITRIALPFQVYVLTQSTVAVGFLAAVQLVPILALSLGAGAVADAVDRRRLILVTSVGMAFCSLALAVLALGSPPSLPAIFGVAFLAASLASIDQPARSSAIPRLVPAERLPAAIALNQLNLQTASIVGPAVGGVIIAIAGLPAAYALDFVSFGAALAAIAAIGPLPPLGGAARPGLSAVLEGLRFARSRPLILSTFAIDFAAMVFGMPTSLFPALGLTVFGAGAIGVGLLAAAPAVGAFVGAALSGWVSGVRRRGRAVILAVAGWGAAIVGFGLATFSFPLALTLLALAGAADVLSAVFRSTIVQLETPDGLRGRVTAIHILVVTSGPRLGDIEAAAVAGLIGPQASVISGGLLCLLGVIGVARAFPQLDAHVAPPPLHGHAAGAAGGSGGPATGPE